MRKEDSGANQSHHRSHCLEHCKLPLRAPSARAENGDGLAQSKTIRDASAQCGKTEDSRQQVFQMGAVKRLVSPANPRETRVTIGSPRKASPHFRRVPVAISSLDDAEVGRITRGCRCMPE